VSGLSAVPGVLSPTSSQGVVQNGPGRRPGSGSAPRRAAPCCGGRGGL